MRIAILGAGSLGSALGQQLHRRGHEIMHGGLATAHETAARIGALAGSSRAAVMFGELVILAVPFQAGRHRAPRGGAARRTDPVVLRQRLQSRTHRPGGRVFHLRRRRGRRPCARRTRGRRDPAIRGGDRLRDLSYETYLAPSVFLCGDDTASKDVVGRLVRELGADPVAAGPLSAARVVEPAMMLIASIAYASVPRDVALRLLERDLD